jgi:hypothetical protein
MLASKHVLQVSFCPPRPVLNFENRLILLFWKQCTFAVVHSWPASNVVDRLCPQVAVNNSSTTASHHISHARFENLHRYENLVCQLQARLSPINLLQLQPGLLLQGQQVYTASASPKQQPNPVCDHMQTPYPPIVPCIPHSAAAMPGQRGQSASDCAASPQPTLPSWRSLQLRPQPAAQMASGQVDARLWSTNSSSSSNNGAKLVSTWQSSFAHMQAVARGHLHIHQLQLRQGTTTFGWQQETYVPWPMQQQCQHSTWRLHTCRSSSSSSSSSNDAAPPAREAADPAAAAAVGQASGPAVADEDYPYEGEVLLDEFEAFDEAVDGGVVDSEWTNEGAVSTSSHVVYQDDSADEYDVEFDEDFDFEDEEGLQDNLPAGTENKDISG